MKSYVDVTVPIRDNMPGFPGDPRCRVTPHQAIGKGDAVNLTRLSFGSHTGTHIDAPSHFIAGGRSVDALDVKCFIGKAKVLDFSDRPCRIDTADIAAHDIRPDDIVLLKTSNSRLMRSQTFREDFVYITPAAAAFLAEKRIATVGFDFLSIEKYDDAGFGAHRALLGAGVAVIEGLDLTDIAAGDYEIIALPLRIENCDGSPARVLLKELTDRP